MLLRYGNNSVCTTTTVALLLLLACCRIGRVLSEQQDQQLDDETIRQGKEFSGYSSTGNLASYSKPLYSGYYTGSSGSGSDATWGSVHPVDDIKPGPPSPPSWQTPSYPPDKVVISYPTDNCLPGLSDLVRGGGSSKLGIVKAGLIALIAALIAKLPVLLLLKAFIFKLIVVPLGFLFFALPVLLPILYFVLPNMMGGMMGGGMGMMGMMTTTTPQPATTTEGGGGGRRSFQVANPKADLDQVLKSLLGSSKCLEQIACKLGARDAESNYKTTVSWLLKAMQNLVPPKNTVIREKLKSYRQAYNLGSNNKDEVCDQRLFPCDIPKLMVSQEKNTFRLI